MSVSFLTPLGALVGVVGLLAVWALLRGRRRSASAAATLGLPADGRRSLVVDVALLGLVAGLIALAAAQPVVARSEDTKGQENAEVLVVMDVTRSMLARRAPSHPSRLERARTVAKRLRAALPETRVGVASLTDRVLPHLFPTLGENSFAAVIDRAIGIERPPPDRRSRRATALLALGDLGRVAFFNRDTERKLAVVLTDGETIPVDFEALRDRLANGRVSTVFVQVWRGDEVVFDENGERDPAYRPDPTSSRSLASRRRRSGRARAQRGRHTGARRGRARADRLRAAGAAGQAARVEGARAAGAPRGVRPAGRAAVPP